MKSKRAATAGQALTEFAVMLGVMVSITLALVVFLGVFGEYAGRILQLVGLEFP